MRPLHRPSPWIFFGVAFVATALVFSHTQWAEELPFWALAGAGAVALILAICAGVFTLMWIRLGCLTPPWVHRLALTSFLVTLALLYPDRALHPARLSFFRWLLESLGVGLSTYLFWSVRAATGPADPAVTKFQRNNLFLLQRLQK